MSPLMYASFSCTHTHISLKLLCFAFSIWTLLQVDIEMSSVEETQFELARRESLHVDLLCHKGKEWNTDFLPFLQKPSLPIYSFFITLTESAFFFLNLLLCFLMHFLLLFLMIFMPLDLKVPLHSWREENSHLGVMYVFS